MPQQPPKPIQACIFDMDGLLINSEDLITTCINQILPKYSRPSLPWSIKARMQGRTATESDEIFQSWANLPISREEYKRQLAEAHKRVFPSAEFLPGVETLLLDLHRSGHVDLALATSSTREKFDLKTIHLGEVFDRVFPSECRILGDDTRLVKHKPDPDCYWLALECINARRKKKGQKPLVRDECLVFEDALQGVQAGMGAGMLVVWCPHLGLLDELRDGEDDEVRRMFAMLFGIDDCDAVKGLPYGEVAECVENATSGRVRLVLILEDFPYAEFGRIHC